MIKSLVNKLPLFHFENLSGFTEIRHFSTTREGGVSTGNYSSFNLGLNSGEPYKEVMENRDLLCDSLGISSSQLIFPKQTHSKNIGLIKDDFRLLPDDRKKEFLRETDALITTLKGIVVAVKTADCVPVLLFDPKKKVIAAIHAGWRGTLAGISHLTVRKMTEEFGSNPSDIFAGIGPSISPLVYEVGKEVWEQFNPDFWSQNGRDPEKKLLDLWKANFSQLAACGIPEDQIESACLCTFSNPSLFYSARRYGIKTGRMATGIMLMD